MQSRHFLASLLLLCLALLFLPACSQPGAVLTGTPVAAIEPTQSQIAPTLGLPVATASLAAPVAQVETPTPIVSPDVYAVVDVALDAALNVRSAPGADSPVLGSIPPYGMGVQIIGPEQHMGGEQWAPVRFGKLEGWVKTAHLARQVGAADEAVAIRAIEAIQALKSRDLEALASLVHPEKGVRLSPYSFVRRDDLIFYQEQIPGLWADPTIYSWGNYDGSGMPIELSFEVYYLEFIYDVGFARPYTLGFNATLGRGNSINNLSEAYPEAAFVEFHFPGFDPQYEGMDWRSLHLVFEQVNGAWFLVGVVHDEWTI